MVYIEILEGIGGLAILIILYSILMPLLNFLRDLTITLGAPAGNAYFLSKLAVWFFIILAVFCLAYMLMAANKEEIDQGR